MGCELACVRRHHCLFRVFSLSLHRRRLIGWMTVSSIHPPSSSTSFHFLTSRRFIAFQIALDTTRQLVFLFVIFVSCRFPPLSFSLSLIVSLGPPPPLRPPISLNLNLSLGFKLLPGRTTSTFTYTKHKYTTYDPRLFRLLRSSFNIGNPIPSHHPHPYVYTFTSTSCIHISHITTASNIVICIPHPPTHGQPLKFAVFQVFLVFFHTFLCLPTSCVLHSVIFEYLCFLELHFTYMRKRKSSSSANVDI